MNRIIPYVFLIFLASCTSMREYKQRIKLSSNPKRAKVYHNNLLLGTTPGFFYIRRSFTGKIILKKEGFKDLEFPLKTSYRWGDSLFSNLVFIYFAPIGWGVDLLTRTAWEYKKISPLAYPVQTPIKIAEEVKTLDEKIIAIAPPEHPNAFLSTEVTEKIIKKLNKEFPNEKIIPFKETETFFSLYAYTNAETIKPEFSDDLYEKLKATHVLKSKITEKNNIIYVTASLFDIFSETIDRELVYEFKKDEFISFSENSYLNWVFSKFSLIPNSLAFDFYPTKDETMFTMSDSSTKYHSYQTELPLAFKYLTRFTLRTITNSRLRSRFDFVFKFTFS